MTDPIEEQVKVLYQLARENPEDENLQTAVKIVKKVRRSRGSLQGWNERYRGDIRSLNDQILIQAQEKAHLQSELQKIVEQKTSIIIQRDKAKAELRKIEIEASIAAAQLRKNYSWYGKFMILWNFVRSVFDISLDMDGNAVITNPNHPNNPRILGDLDDLNDKPWMGTDSASIQRDLLDR
jgi:hypothetical protein